MENITSGIDKEISLNYAKMMQKFPSMPHDCSSDDSDCDEYMGGDVSMESEPFMSVSIPAFSLCKCKVIQCPSSMQRNYAATARQMWFTPLPSHMHDGTNHKCGICTSIQCCNDIPILIQSGNMFREISGGAKKQSKNLPADCAINAISTIAQEANKVLNYIYSHYKNTETNQPITEGMIAQAMQTLKLNVLHTDLPRLFEMVISKHKRGIGRSDYVEHPLSYIVCHMKELINPLLVFEKSIEGYSYNELLNNLRLQSAEYDPAILQTLPLKFDISTMIHPLFVAMFWKQLPTVEGMCVESDQFQLLKNIHITHDKIKPSHYNFELTTSRWNEKSPIAFFGVTNVIDTEIKRVLCHVYLKKIIYRLRTGELHSIDSNKLISWLQKVFIFNSYDTGDEAEQLISAFLNLFLIRPIKIFVQDQISLGVNCGYLVNTPAEDYMKECPFIYCETTSQIGGVPYNFMPTELTCLRYDKMKNKAILSLNTVSSSRQPVVIGNCQPALTCNGLLPIFTRRKAALTYRDNTLLAAEDSIEYINTAYLNVQTEYTIDSKIYKLTSVLCYHTIKPETGLFLSDKEIAAGYYALVQTEDGWLKYNTNAFAGAMNVDELRKKYLTWARKLYQTHPIYERLPGGGEGPHSSDLKFSDAYLNDKFMDKFGNGMIDAQLLVIDSTEAMNLINTHSCLLLYAEDYDTYKLANLRNRFT